MLANWLYFLALGLVIPVLGRVISTVVNTDGSPNVSPASSIVGGDVEALDKLCTFLFVGFLGALSDVLGRKPLMAYSALGFSLTCYIQVRAAALCTAAPQRCSPAAPQPHSRSRSRSTSARRLIATPLAPPLACRLQARAKGVSMLFLADLIDGLSSCTRSLCRS